MKFTCGFYTFCYGLHFHTCMWPSVVICLSALNTFLHALFACYNVIFFKQQFHFKCDILHMVLCLMWFILLYSCLIHHNMAFSIFFLKHFLHKYFIIKFMFVTWFFFFKKFFIVTWFISAWLIYCPRILITAVIYKNSNYLF